MDSDLNFYSHIKTITKSVYYHIKNISRIKGLISQQDLEKLVHAFIFSRLNYYNGVFTGLPKKTGQTAAADSECCCSSPH